MNAQIPQPPTAADIRAAAERLKGHIVETPLVESQALNERFGARILFKPETLQRSGSFKFRGAYNKISSIPADKRAAGVVAFSSGNHAQGVAAAAKMLGLRATIVMPKDAPKPKRDRTAAFGAEVVLYDRDKGEDREVIARGIADERGAVMVPPYDDPLIIAGQGTAGREIVDDLATMGLKPDVVVVPNSGGGLTAGVAIAVRDKAPNAKIITAEPEGFDDFLRSLRSGQRESNPRPSGTICDGLMTGTPGEITFAVNRKLVADGVTVSDADVGKAIAFAFRELKLVVEPSGAITLAALLTRKIDVRGKVAVAVLSGGNIDPQLFNQLVA